MSSKLKEYSGLSGINRIPSKNPEPNKPRANFTSNTTLESVNIPINFYDMSYPGDGPILERYWTFGDGNDSTSENPIHIYTNSGNFTVSLRIRTIYGEDTEIKENYIHIKTLPIVDFSATDTTGYIPFSTTFINNTIPGEEEILYYLWDFGDGNDSTSENPIHVYTTANNFTVSLSAHTISGNVIRTKLDYITSISETIEIFESFNPNDKTSLVTLSNYNLTMIGKDVSGMSNTARTTIYKNSGKWYWEVTADMVSSGFLRIGLSDRFCGLRDFSGNYNPRLGQTYFPAKNKTYSNFLWISNSYALYSDGNLWNNYESSTLFSFIGGDTIGVAFDSDSGKVWFTKDGTWINGGNPVTGVNPHLSNVFKSTNNNYYLFPSVATRNSNATINFGSSDFVHTVPEGYSTSINFSGTKIIYSSLTMYGNNTQELSINNYDINSTYLWETNHGTFSSYSGESTVFTPTNGFLTSTINLYKNGSLVDSINIEIIGNVTYDSLGLPTPSGMARYPARYDYSLTGIGDYVYAYCTTMGTGTYRYSGSIGKNSGKWYVELTPIYITSNTSIGIISSAFSSTNRFYRTADGWGWYGVDGKFYNNNIVYGTGETWSDIGTSDPYPHILGLAIDYDSGKIWFAKNGVWQLNGNPITGDNPNLNISISESNLYYICYEAYESGRNCYFNFGQFPFYYSVPTGFNPGYYNLI